MPLYMTQVLDSGQVLIGRLCDTYGTEWGHHSILLGVTYDCQHSSFAFAMSLTVIPTLKYLVIFDSREVVIMALLRSLQGFIQSISIQSTDISATQRMWLCNVRCTILLLHFGGTPQKVRTIQSSVSESVGSSGRFLIKRILILTTFAWHWIPIWYPKQSTGYTMCSLLHFRYPVCQSSDVCLVSCVPTNARFYHIERKVLFAIPLHRIPIDTCQWHTGHYCHTVC
jgi:hypothetical protein